MSKTLKNFKISIKNQSTFQSKFKSINKKFTTFTSKKSVQPLKSKN